MPSWQVQAAALRCAQCCLSARGPQPGAALVCKGGGEGGEKAERKAGFALLGCGHPCKCEVGADTWAPSIICTPGGLQAFVGH